MKTANLRMSNVFYSDGALDRETWFRVASLDYKELIRAVDFCAFFEAENIRHLLDVGCGTGKLPQMISEAAAGTPYPAIRCDYLDPSDYSLSAFADNLSPPFVPATAFRNVLEEMDVAAMPVYDLVWAIHSLYVLDANRLRQAMANFLSVIREGGTGVIYHASAAAFYHRFYRAWLADFGTPDRKPYITAEQLQVFLPPEYRATSLCFDHRIDAQDRATVEYYLRQLCFDKKTPLEAMERGKHTGPLLQQARGEDGVYRFRQQVLLICNKDLQGV